MKNQKYDEVLAQAKSAYEKGGWDAAFDYIDDCIEKNPNLPEAYIVRGELHGIIEAYQVGIADLDNAIDLNPNSAYSYYTRGTLYAKSGNNNKALDDFNKAIELDANYADAYANRGNIYLILGKFHEVISDCGKAIELSAGTGEESFAPYHNRSIAYMNLGEFEKAFEDYNKAIETGPEEPGLARVYINRGAYYSELNKPQEAIRDLEKAIELDPNDKYTQDARDAIKKLKAGKNISTGLLSGGGYSKPGKNRKLIIMIIGLVIGGVIGVLLGMGGYWYIGLLIGAYFGIGIGPFGHHLKEEIGDAWYHIKMAFNMVNNEDGSGVAANLILVLWYLIRLFFWFLVSPFIAVYQLVTGK